MKNGFARVSPCCIAGLQLSSFLFALLAIKVYFRHFTRLYMFGPELLQQLMQLKSATDSGMSKLPEIIIEGSSGNGLVKIKLDGTYALKELKLATDIKHMELEDLEDFLSLALKQAIDEVTVLREKELASALTELIQNR